MRHDVDEAGIRSYLLGRLPEPEAEALEEAYLAEPEVLERVGGVEDDLLDDYAAGRLDAAERQAFESRYLASPPLRERLAAARALHRRATNVVLPPRAITSRGGSWLVPLAAAAGLVLALAAVSRWPSRPTHVTTTSPAPTPVDRPEGQPSPSGKPVESPPAPALSSPPPSRATSVLALALSPVLLRGPGRPVELRIPPGTDTVVFEMEGDPAAVPASARTLEADLKTVEGQELWRGTAERAAQPGRPSLVAFARVPAARLAQGDYLLTLSGPGGDEGTLYRYFLRVASPRALPSPGKTP